MNIDHIENTCFNCGKPIEENETYCNECNEMNSAYSDEQ